METFEPGAENTEESEPGVEEQPSESEIGPEPPGETEPSGSIHHGHGAPGVKPPGHKLGGSAPSFSPEPTLDIPEEAIEGLLIHLPNGVEISNRNGKWVDVHGVAYKPVLKPKLSTEPGREIGFIFFLQRSILFSGHDFSIITMELEWEPDIDGSSTPIEEAQFANSLLIQSLGSQQPDESGPSAPSGEFKIPETPSVPLPDIDEVMKANKENDEEASETDEGEQEPEEEEEEEEENASVSTIPTISTLTTRKAYQTTISEPDTLPQ